MVRLGEGDGRGARPAPYYLYRQKYMAGQQQTNVGYARPGAACLYNVDIMETTSILAMGAGIHQASACCRTGSCASAARPT